MYCEASRLATTNPCSLCENSTKSFVITSCSPGCRCAWGPRIWILLNKSSQYCVWSFSFDFPVWAWIKNYITWIWTMTFFSFFFFFFKYMIVHIVVLNLHGFGLERFWHFNLLYCIVMCCFVFFSQCFMYCPWDYFCFNLWPHATSQWN